MKNLTKLFCDLLSAGSQFGDTSIPSEVIANRIKGLACHMLPEDCDVDFDLVSEHIENCRCAMKGADYDIDKIRKDLAQGKPVNIRRIVEFHNKLTVTLSDDSQLSFNATDIVHY